jgi:hypothetical protein
MEQMTITEALAEIKTIEKRLVKKREFVNNYLWRQELLKDPHEADGGSRVAIAKERQSIRDLEERIVSLRRAIAKANEFTGISVNNVTRSIADWLTWRREVAPGQQKFLAELRNRIAGMRNDAMKKGLGVKVSDTPQASHDIVVNLNEQELAEESERLETILGSLDGQLSLRNATVLVTME